MYILYTGSIAIQNIKQYTILGTYTGNVEQFNENVLADTNVIDHKTSKGMIIIPTIDDAKVNFKYGIALRPRFIPGTNTVANKLWTIKHTRNDNISADAGVNIGIQFMYQGDGSRNELLYPLFVLYATCDITKDSTLLMRCTKRYHMEAHPPIHYFEIAQFLHPMQNKLKRYYTRLPVGSIQLSETNKKRINKYIKIHNGRVIAKQTIPPNFVIGKLTGDIYEFTKV